MIVSNEAAEIGRVEPLLAVVVRLDADPLAARIRDDSDESVGIAAIPHEARAVLACAQLVLLERERGILVVVSNEAAFFARATVIRLDTGHAKAAIRNHPDATVDLVAMPHARTTIFKQNPHKSVRAHNQ